MKQQLTNPDFTVDQFAQEMAMSRMAFYRKMNALIGMTPNKYLNGRPELFQPCLQGTLWRHTQGGAEGAAELIQAIFQHDNGVWL